MTIKKIHEIYKEFRVPAHIKAHMEKVKELAVELANSFIENGEKVDKKLIMNAALLHDALRICDIKDLDQIHFFGEIKKEDMKIWENLKDKYKDKGHSQAIYEYLKGIGEEKIGKLIKKHDFFEIDNLKTWEEKILYYADKRAEGDRTVILKERFFHGRKRNFKEDENLEKLAKTEEKVFLLEKEIVKRIKKMPF
jgi:HD superfamily phosphohydrolase YqeK